MMCPTHSTALKDTALHTISFQERCGKPGGGKGILIQDEHTGALSTLYNQYVLSYSDGVERESRRSDGGVRGVYCVDVIGALQYDDYKGPNRQYVDAGKLIVCKT